MHCRRFEIYFFPSTESKLMFFPIRNVFWQKIENNAGKLILVFGMANNNKMHKESKRLWHFKNVEEKLGYVGTNYRRNAGMKWISHRKIEMEESMIESIYSSLHNLDENLNVEESIRSLTRGRNWMGGNIASQMRLNRL